MTLQYHYVVPGDDFVHAGEASGHLKGILRQLGYPNDAIRRVAISMYEGEITGEFSAGAISKEEIGYCMTGSRREAATHGAGNE